MKTDTLTKPILLFLTVICLILIAGGCYYFRVNRTPEPTASDLQKTPLDRKFVVLHFNDQAWHFTNIVLYDDTIKGIITPLVGHEKYKTVKPEAANRYKKTVKHDESEILNEVHIFTTEVLSLGTYNVSVPVKAITRIDAYDEDKAATVASWTFSAIGVGAATSAVIIVIVFLIKESCPFIYAYNGTDFFLAGEIFSGAVQPGMERDDYLLLPSIVPDEGTYKIKITNEVHEIQSVNFSELMVFDHPSTSSVLIDKNGVPYSFSKPSLPFEARIIGNMDVLPLISNKDSLSYMGKETDKSGKEELIIKFIKPKDARTSRLIIRAKNSFWLDGLIYKINKLFGERYYTYSSKQEKAPGDKLRKWQLDQKMPLSVYIEKNNKWEFVDYFNLTGPMALRDDILPLDLNGISSDTIKIKLSTGFLFWEIDYTAMDFGTNDMVSVSSIPVKAATDNNDIDVKDFLRCSDNSYFVLDEVGDEALLTFDVPELRDTGRTVFLHTRGYYKILMDQSGEPDKKTLRTFRKPNRLPEFSKEMYDSLSHK
jgi:hypothetical protein